MVVYLMYFFLSLQEDVLVTDTLPSLPMTIDNMAGALIGDLLLYRRRKR